MGAVFSPCGTFRMVLDREIADTGPVAAICGVNPSTAGEVVNDQTIRKDMGFGRVHGWSRIFKINKFAYRATDIKALANLSSAEAIGPENDLHIERVMMTADVLIFAWGPLAKLPPRLRTRWRSIWHMSVDLGKTPLCFGTAKDGHPLHTLMLPYSSELRPWSSPL